MVPKITVGLVPETESTHHTVTAHMDSMIMVPKMSSVMFVILNVSLVLLLLSIVTNVN